MKQLLSYPLSAIFYLYYGLMLVLFHPLQILALRLSGDRARKNMVDRLNWCLIKGLYILGCRVSFRHLEKIPKNRPIIIVANHQSMFDIPAVVIGFKDHYPRFISKLELAKNLPSISLNLRHGQSALIDRSKGAQSVKEILKLGRLTEQRKEAACIFPEGTRSRNGKVKEFQSAGLLTLLRAAPSAVIVPYVIEGHDRLMRHGNFPLSGFQRITYTVLDPIEPKDHPVEELGPLVRERIVQVVGSR